MTRTTALRRLGQVVVVGLISMLALGACGSSSGVSASDLNGSWSLTSVTGADGQTVAIPAGVSPGITFQDGQVNGDTGCNSFSGSFTLDGSTIDFGPLKTTRMVCADDVNAVETAYLTALDAVDSVTIDGTTLTLSTSGGDSKLIFSRS
jgi:heat shock protein HslJ